MWEIIELAMKSLKIKSETTRTMRDRVLQTHTGKENIHALLDELQTGVKDDRCGNCDNRSFCALFHVCIYYELGELKESEAQAKKAMDDFRTLGHVWNENITRWILGLIYIQLDQERDAHQKLTKAKIKFTRTKERYQRESKYNKRDLCLSFTKKIQDMLDNPSHYKTVITKKTYPKNNLPKRKFTPSTLIFPVHSQVKAGEEGNFVFENSPSLDARLNEITFNEIPHELYNLQKEGNPIILYPRVYRWFHVEGNSMNQASPIPIDNADYILTIDLNMSNHDLKIGTIIIAELYNSSQNERAGFVKRFTSEGLISESSAEYQEIPRDDVSIRGVAIAVAKPKKT